MRVYISCFLDSLYLQAVTVITPCLDAEMFQLGYFQGVILFVNSILPYKVFPYLNHIGVSIARTIYSNLLSLPHSGRR